MKVGVVLADDKGMESFVCAHFGQCLFFFLIDIDSDTKKVTKTQIVPNPVSHGGGGCVTVDEILKYGITHVIAGGMGMNAQNKFANAGVKVFGYEGKVKEGLAELLNNTIGGLEPCKEHGHEGECHH